MTNRYCQAVGCYDAVEAHKLYSPMDNIKSDREGGTIGSASRHTNIEHRYNDY